MSGMIIQRIRKRQSDLEIRRQIDRQQQFAAMLDETRLQRDSLALADSIEQELIEQLSERRPWWRFWA